MTAISDRLQSMTDVYKGPLFKSPSSCFTVPQKRTEAAKRHRQCLVTATARDNASQLEKLINCIGHHLVLYLR